MRLHGGDGCLNCDVEERARRNPWRATPLLDDHRQVHSLVDDTIDVVGSRCGKWPYLNALAIDLHVADGRCARLVRWSGHAILPTLSRHTNCFSTAWQVAALSDDIRIVRQMEELAYDIISSRRFSMAVRQNNDARHG